MISSRKHKKSILFAPFEDLFYLCGHLFALPQLSIPQLVDFYKKGRFNFDKLVKFYKFDDINQASSDSLTGKTIKPILIIDEDYVPGK